MRGKGKNIEELIRLEAYLLSEKAGHPAHMERHFWVEAEAIVKARATKAKPAAKRKVARETVLPKPAQTAKKAAPVKAKAAAPGAGPVELPATRKPTAAQPAQSRKKAAPAAAPESKAPAKGGRKSR